MSRNTSAFISGSDLVYLKHARPNLFIFFPSSVTLCPILSFRIVAVSSMHSNRAVLALSSKTDLHSPVEQHLPSCVKSYQNHCA